MIISIYLLACYSLLTKFHLTDYFILGKKEKQAQGQGDEEALLTGQQSGADDGVVDGSSWTGLHSNSSHVWYTFHFSQLQSLLISFDYSIKSL